MGQVPASGVQDVYVVINALRLIQKIIYKKLIKA
jgi:hypothetical protein